jgi:hypothetical protein
MKDMNEPTPPQHAEAEAIREKAEGSRQVAEQDRQQAEGERQVAEGARIASEGVRAEVLDSVHAAAETLQATLEQMKVVEDMRRTPHEIQNVGKLSH